MPGLSLVAGNDFLITDPAFFYSTQLFLDAYFQAITKQMTLFLFRVELSRGIYNPLLPYSLDKCQYPYALEGNFSTWLRRSQREKTENIVEKT